MTKRELLKKAVELGIEIASSAKKGEVEAAIEAFYNKPDAATPSDAPAATQPAEDKGEPLKVELDEIITFSVNIVNGKATVHARDIHGVVTTVTKNVGRGHLKVSVSE